MIFRDDDISCVTDLNRFMQIDSIFREYGVPHTIAVITRDIAKHTALVDYIRSCKHILPELHCVDHVDFTLLSNAELIEQFARGKQEMQDTFGDAPTVFYPPWNRTDDRVNQLAFNHGLEVSWQKISLSPYVQANGLVNHNVLNFHYWADQECQFLHPALQLYKKLHP